MNISLMHVTTVPQTLGFFRGQIGYLKSRGMTVSVASSPGPALDAFAAAEGVQAFAVPMTRKITPFQDALSLIRLVSVVIRHRPDIVHSHTPKAALLGTMAARLTRRRAVLSIFGLPQMTRKGLGKRILDMKTRFECALAHRVWCDSFSVRDFLVSQRLCRGEKIVVLGQGSVAGVDSRERFNPARFDPQQKSALRKHRGIPEHALVIGFVGRIVRDKGISELASSWNLLRARYPDLHLLIVGEPEATDPIDPGSDAILRRDDRVHFTGQQKDPVPFFAMMDIFVMPSYREGFGVTNIEAAAFALPVVSTRIPGCVDSVADGRTGTLVPVRDSVALADALARYIDDLDLRRAHGDAGRNRVLSDFEPRRIWEELASLYEAVLRG